MRFGFVTMCTPGIEPVGRLSRPNRAAYCERHRYCYVEGHRVLDAGRRATWSKLLLLLELLDEYDWLFWSDADSLILRPELPLSFFTEDPASAGADLLITRDRHGCNSGQFLVSNRSGRARPLLEAAYTQSQFMAGRLSDQPALTHVIDANLTPVVARYVSKVLLNAEIYDVTGDSFLVHFLGQPARVYLMRKWLRERPDLAEGGSVNPATPASPSAGASPRLAEAAEHLRAGRVAEAQALCRQLLAAHPDHPAATHLLGLACRAAGKNDEGFDLLCRSLELAPGVADFHNNLGAALAESGLGEDAAECFRRALALRPDFPAAEANLRQRNEAPPPRRRLAPIPAAKAGDAAPHPRGVDGTHV